MSRFSFALAVFVFASQVLNSNKGYSQNCWNLTPTASCFGFLGNRIPDYGCVGCNNAHECVEPDEAMRSIPLSNWNDPGKAAYLSLKSNATCSMVDMGRRP